jgi:hypothetical protein
VESSCEFGIEPSGSMKCWETISSGLTSSGPLSNAQFHRVSYLAITDLRGKSTSTGGAKIVGK